MSQPQTHADLANDLSRLDAQLLASLPDWVCEDPALTVELSSSVFYRNKGAYLVGRISTITTKSAHFRRIPEPRTPGG